MGVPSKEVLERLPQKSPFLFVDECVEKSDTKIMTKFQVTGDEDFFKGHFPGNPIMPGVLLQEAAFQSGALLMTYIKPESELGVVSRVQDVKFKNFVKPGDLLEMEISLEDQLENAFYMKGRTRVNGKVVMAISFTGTSL
jgi:3-hydroxyacyl-[acyl-carrier-protein] dehydratase